ncbi:carboxypeptidase regulatory-like domain-containing protein [Micromonospora sp. NPDC049523]|uniref:carboxypeptidase regulatory-like domain-containing protein n=1 Tax=Micromonospora sp. NPDC049523 TaxID=3155921 RepID=UPI0034272162
MKSTVLRALAVAAMAGLLATNLPAPALAAAQGPGLEGTITNQLTGEPVSGAGIVIQHRDGSGWNFANSDNAGMFAFPEATGDYVVRVMASGYVEQWLNGHQNQWEADTITAPATLQIPMMPIQYGDLAGRVVTQNGGGLADVGVELRRNNNWVAHTGTDAKGRYQFPNIEAGPNYTIKFILPSGQQIWYDGASSEWDATPFTVNPDTTTTVNLTRPPVGHLTIRALDKVTRQPIVGYCFYPQGGPLNWATTCTDATGRAKVRELPVGDYRGGGFDPNEVYVNGHFEPVAVTEGDTTTATVRLEKSVSLRVNFVDAVTGEPVDGACVTMVDPVQSELGDNGHCGNQVELKNLFAQDHFRLFVSPYDQVHGAQWVSKSGGGTGDPDRAKVYRPKPGERIEVSVKLDGAGTVAGFVKDAVTGAGVGNVCPTPTSPSASSGPNPLAGCTWSDGQYAIRNLGPYQWKLAFPAYDAQHAWTWSGGGVNRASATPVQVVAGTTTALDVALPATGTISGTVTVPAGTCLECVSITAVDAATGDYAGYRPVVRADGTFSMKGFNTQDVRLFYSASEDVVEYPTQLHTTAGETVSGITIVVPAP